MRYYTVDLFDVKYTDDYRGQTIFVDEVIVKRGLRTVTELLTDQEIEILPKKALIGRFGVVAENYHDKEQFRKTGYHLVVLEEDLVPKNLTTSEDIDRYVGQYDGSQYQKVYESIKEKTTPKTDSSQLKVRQKAKMVSGTRK